MKRSLNFLRKGQLWIASVIVGVAALSLAACGDSKSTKANEAKKLVIGTSADNPPFEFYTTGADKEFQGFDIDLGQALGELLGVEVEFQDMDFNALIPALQSGRIEMALAAMTPTDERGKNVDFSSIYFRARHAVITPASVKITQEAQLQGKKVGVQMGSTFEVQLKEIAQRVPDITIVSLNRLGELVQELRSKRIDVVLTEEAIAKAYVGSHLDIDAHVLEGQGGEFAIALPKASSLVTKVNEALQKLQENGKLDQIRAKWFPSQ